MTTMNEANRSTPAVFQPAEPKRMRAWPFVLLALGLLLFIFSMVFSLFDVEDKYRDVWFALGATAGLVCAVSMVCLLVVNGRLMPLAGKVVAVVFLLVAIGPSFAPYMGVERLTDLYGAQFENGYKQLGYFKDYDYLKVLKYKGDGPYVYCSNSGISEELASATEDQAVVMYVVDNHSAEVVVVFNEVSDVAWQMQSWGAVWSTSGNADDFTWPMYR